MREKLVLKTTNISRIVLYIFAISILIWQNVHAFESSKIGVYLGVVALSLAVGYLLDKKSKWNQMFEWSMLVFCCILFGGICFWWVAKVPYKMEGDQAIVWQAAVLALENNFSMYVPGGQMSIYPQQQGLAFIYEILYRIAGDTSPKLIGYINALMAPLTLFFGYQCVKECGSTKAAVRFLPLMMCCLPYIIYSPYVYGDVPSICYSFIILWSALRFLKTNRYGYAITACIVASLALLSRMNIWIFFIGVFIGLCYYSWDRWSWKAVLLAISIMLCAFLSITAVKEYNSIRSGYPVSKGMPSVLWMAMGIQYGEQGAGYYNNYSKEVYYRVGGDYEAAAAIGIQEIKDRIKVFRQYPEQIEMFFEQKLSSQWQDPLFESIKFTGTFKEDAEEHMDSVIKWIYKGTGKNFLYAFCENIMSVVYAFALIGVIYRFFKHKEIVKDIPLIVVVGGFLFSIIWEAKARYMLPYYILLIMYAAYGLTNISEEIKKAVSRFGNCKRKK